MNPSDSYPGELHRLSSRKLWYGFSAPAFAWAAHGAVAVFLSTVYCPAGVPHWEKAGEGGVRLAIGLVALGLLAISISAGIVAYRLWHALQEEHRVIRDSGRSREDFMALGGILVSVVCTTGIVWAGIPLIMLDVV